MNKVPFPKCVQVFFTVWNIPELLLACEKHVHFLLKITHLLRRLRTEANLLTLPFQGDLGTGYIPMDQTADPYLRVLGNCNGPMSHTVHRLPCSLHGSSPHNTCKCLEGELLDVLGKVPPLFKSEISHLFHKNSLVPIVLPCALLVQPDHCSSFQARLHQANPLHQSGNFSYFACPDAPQAMPSTQIWAFYCHSTRSVHASLVMQKPAILPLSELKIKMRRDKLMTRYLCSISYCGIILLGNLCLNV